MEQLVVVTYPQPIHIETRPIEHDAVPDGAVGLGYYHAGNLIARGVVAPDSVDAIKGLLDEPVSLALAETEDEQGNIDARVCLVLPVDGLSAEDDDEDEEDEPWKASVPKPPTEIEANGDGRQGPDEDGPRVALLPIGNVVRAVKDRHHPTEVEVDVWEMLENLVNGGADDAVRKAIDDLLREI